DFEGLEDFEEGDIEEAEEGGEAEAEGQDLEEDFSLPDEFSFDEEEAGEPAGEEEFEGLPEFGDLGEEEELSDVEFGAEAEGEAEEDFDFGETEDETEDEAEDDFGGEFELPGEEEEAFEEGTEEEADIPEEIELSEEGEEEFEVDEFSIDDLGQDFGVLEDVPEGSPFEDVGIEGIEEEIEAVDEEGEEEAEFSLSDDDFFALRNTLLTLPLNLKIMVEELIGEKGLKGKNLDALTRALADGKSPKEIASLVSKITGQRVEIPAQYSKMTGAEFEKKKESFWYILRYSILPVVTKLVLAGAAAALIIFVSYRFIYRPIYAYYLYDRGYEQLEERDYQEANTLFNRARDHWKMKKQYFRYAEGYKEQEQWILAEEKYETLIYDFPDEKQAYLDFAEMELEKLANYEKASSVLKLFLEREPEDYEAILLLGDTYLEWGKEDSSKYEEARYQYADLMDMYGVKNELLFRMLKYFIRTDDFTQVDILKNRFEADQELEVDPEAYAELGGYLLDKDRIEGVQDILLRAKESSPFLPEIHYHLSRYFNRMEEYGDEKRALLAALENFQNMKPLSSERLAMKIDTHRRLGNRWYAEEEYLRARASYNEGRRSFEDALERRILERGEQFGRLYKDIGDLHYYVGGDLEQALSMFNEAEANSFAPSDLKYKKGYIYYKRGDFREALVEFQRAAGSFSNNPNLIYSTANTLYRRKNFHSADGYYKHLHEILRRRLEQERPLDIVEQRSHRELVSNLMRTSNNLGVTLYRLSEKTGRAEYSSEAMVKFSDSSEYFDTLSRDPETLERAGLSNLAYLNQRAVIYPEEEEYSLQIYPDIPMDMEKDLLN
ncbi:MAG: periplasmic flagellar collar protein FlcA, partial [Spirochaetaceae bacterium]